MKTPQERGPVGAWVYQERDERNWSVEHVANAIGVHPATIRGIESGHKQASQRIRRELEKLFETEAPETEKERAGDLPALIEALRDQTAAMNDLVAALRGQRPSVDPAELVSSLAEALAQHFRPRSEEDAPESGDPPEQDTAPSPQRWVGRSVPRATYQVGDACPVRLQRMQWSGPVMLGSIGTQRRNAQSRFLVIR